MSKLDAAIDWIGHEAMAIALWAADPALAKPLKIYKRKHANDVADYLSIAHDALLEKRDRGMVEDCPLCENWRWYFVGYRFDPGYCPSCGKLLRKE